MKVAICSVLFLSLACSQALSQSADHSLSNPVSVNECFGKGGLGIINTSLYIDLRSDRNHLILTEGKEWTGQDVGRSETVFVFNGNAWQQRTPDGFDLSKAVIISFEKDRVRFFDFKRMEGGFYRRHSGER